jgi:hypothetical protein
VADVAAGEQRPFAAASTISCSCIRIVTHQQLFKEPALIESAAHFCDALQRHPLARSIEAGTRHQTIVRPRWVDTPTH